MIHKSFDFTKLGGFPLNQQRLEYMQSAYAESLQAISNLIGDNVIVSGCIINGNNVTDGWVIVNGELLPFVGGSNVLQSTFLIRTATTALTFKDAAQKDVQFLKFCSFGIGGDAINWSQLTRLKSYIDTQTEIAELTTKVTTQAADIAVLKAKVITGQIYIDFPLDGSKTDIFTTDPPQGVNPSEYVGFLNFGMIDRVTSSVYTVSSGKIGFAVIRENTNYGVAGHFDYVLIKKQ